MPAVSIITTLYNCEKYVLESLESIRDQQGFDDYEWLIANDGSTDSTWDIVKDFCDKTDLSGEVRLFDDGENKKIPRRRNEVIAEANGKYVAIHDGDDVSLPWRFSSEYGMFQEYPDLFCIGGHAIKINLESEPSGLMDYPNIKHKQIISQFYNKVNPMIDPTTMFKREDFNELGRYTLREELYTVPDMDLWSRAILSGRKFANIGMPVIKYRANPNSMTGAHKEEMIQAHMIVWREFVDEFRTKFMSQENADNEQHRERQSMDQRRNRLSARKSSKQNPIQRNRPIP